MFLACAAFQTLAGKIQEYIKAVAQLARLYYVERCHKTFVVNAPAWFGLSFRVVSPFLSARTRQKIRILGSDLTVLQDEIDPQVGCSDIDPSSELVCLDWLSIVSCSTAEATIDWPEEGCV